MLDLRQRRDGGVYFLFDTIAVSVPQTRKEDAEISLLVTTPFDR
jgi:hypothetical protein